MYRKYPRKWNKSSFMTFSKFTDKSSHSRFHSRLIIAAKELVSLHLKIARVPRRQLIKDLTKMTTLWLHSSEIRRNYKLKLKTRSNNYTLMEIIYTSNSFPMTGVKRRLKACLLSMDKYLVWKWTLTTDGKPLLYAMEMLIRRTKIS